MLASACSPMHKVQKRGGYLLSGNVVKTDRPGISVSDLSNFAQPKPNSKFLGLFRVKVWIYDAFTGRRDTKFRKWMRNHLGNPPVLADSVLADNSRIPMKVYLNNKGYFGARVSRKIVKHHARIKVIYSTITPEPYHFGEIAYSIKDDSIRYFVNRMKGESLLKSGAQYDAYLLGDERERITRELKDLGYFAFLREYIYFDVDTSSKTRVANIRLVIRNVKNPDVKEGDSVAEKAHQRYYINNVYVYSSQRMQASDSVRVRDTLRYYRDPLTQNLRNPDFNLIYRKSLRIRPNLLARSIYIIPGNPFSQKDINLTYNRLQNLSISRYVSVNVVPPRFTRQSTKPLPALLDCEIRFVRSPVNLFTIEAEGTNAGGFVGLGSSVTYRNLNIFKGSETLRLKVNGAFEIQPSLGLGTDGSGAIFNSKEAGIQTGIDFPSLLSPFPVKNSGKDARAKTSVSLGFNYQDRTEYLRYISSVSMGYEWNASSTLRHYLTPIDISSVSITRDSLFTASLINLKDPRFLNQYTDHLIMALKYSLVFSNQDIMARNNFVYFRMNLESAGNVLDAFSRITHATQDEEGNYTAFGIRFAQYLRGDFDFRYYKPITEKQKVVYRAAFGIGVPYGNSTSLPFEKGFFAGGANGLRGWPVRSLGPGTYQSTDSTSFENIGDLWIEANLEYRFPMYSLLQGALFTDIGNIWLLRPNEDFPGGAFNFNTMFRSIAFDGGFGLRFDFSLFIFRIDGGLPLYDPGQDSGNRWVRFGKFQMKDLNWNFGIGYPF